MAAYEGAAYWPVKVEVTVCGGRRSEAAAFMAVLGRLRSSGRTRFLEDWQRRQKPTFVRTVFRRR